MAWDVKPLCKFLGGIKMVKDTQPIGKTTAKTTTATELQAVKGIDVILLFRLLKDAEKEPAGKLAFQTDHEHGKTKDSESTPTKDGPIRVPGVLDISFSCTSILSLGDPMVDKLEEALDNDDIVEIWEINKAESNEKGKFKATYYQGYVTGFSKSPAAEGNVELSLDFGVNGTGAKGFATLTDDQSTIVQYAFRDTIAGSKPEPEPEEK